MQNLFVAMLLLGMGVLSWAQSNSSDVVYFLEARHGEPAASQTANRQPSAGDKALYQLAPSQLLRFQCTRNQYIERLQREQEGEGAWVKLEIDGGNGPKTAYIYDFWKSFVTIDPSLQPIHLVFADSNRPSITVFSAPGFSGWQSCLRQHDRCVAWPTRKAELLLLDTRIVENRRARSRLFYKIQYSYATEAGLARQGEGWVPASSVRRIVVKPPEFHKLAADELPIAVVAAGDYVTKQRADEMVREAEKRTLARFQIDAPDIGNQFSRWTVPMDSSRSPSSNASAHPEDSLNFKIDFDLNARAGLMNVSQSTASGNSSVGEEVAGLAFSGIAPILFDLEAGGTLEYLEGLHRVSGEGPLVDMLRFNQEVLRTLKSSPKNTAIKLGVGWSLQYVTSGANYGLDAVVGLRGVAIFDSAPGTAYFKFGPIANSAGLSTKNYEGVLGGGLRFNPEIGYRSISFTGEARFMTDTSRITENRTDFWTLVIGLQKTF